MLSLVRGFRLSAYVRNMSIPEMMYVCTIMSYVKRFLLHRPEKILLKLHTYLHIVHESCRIAVADKVACLYTQKRWKRVT